MCGIVGYITTEKRIGATARLKYLNQAIVANTLRGDDSTGAFAIGADHEKGTSPGWCKQVCDGYSFTTGNEDFDQMMGEGDDVFAAIAHNRAATVGGVTVDAAHPFQEGPITLVHNGTLYYTADLPMSQHMCGAVNDSHTIAHNFAKHSAKDVIPMLSGAFALVWHDSRDNTMNIVRNDDRPLHLASVQGQDTIFIASEPEMMHWLLARNKLTIKTLAYPKPGQILTFQHGTLVPEISEVDLYSATHYYTYGYGYDRGTKGKDYSKSWPTREEPDPVGKPLTSVTPHPSSNTIKIGGKKQQVPVRAQELMLEHDFLVEDRYTFSPNYSMLGQNGRLALVGKLRETGGEAVIYGLAKRFVEGDRTKRDWVVRPITSKALCTGSPLIVCKVCTTHAPSNEIPFDKPVVNLLPAPKESHDPVMVPGPHGVWIPEEEFMDKAGKGCVQCAGNIYASDADEVIWVNGDLDPLCPRCAADFYYGENRGYTYEN